MTTPTTLTTRLRTAHELMYALRKAYTAQPPHNQNTKADPGQVNQVSLLMSIVERNTDRHQDFLRWMFNLEEGQVMSRAHFYVIRDWLLVSPLSPKESRAMRDSTIPSLLTRFDDSQAAKTLNGYLPRSNAFRELQEFFKESMVEEDNP